MALASRKDKEKERKKSEYGSQVLRDVGDDYNWVCSSPILADAWLEI